MRKGRVVGAFMDATASSQLAEVVLVADKVGDRLGMTLNASLRTLGQIL